MSEDFMLIGAHNEIRKDVKVTKQKLLAIKKEHPGTFLVLQWYDSVLPMQGAHV